MGSDCIKMHPVIEISLSPLIATSNVIEMLFEREHCTLGCHERFECG